MLAMEMKGCGAYVSRSLSFKQAEVWLTDDSNAFWHSEQFAIISVKLVRGLLSSVKSACDVMFIFMSSASRFRTNNLMSNLEWGEI